MANNLSIFSAALSRLPAILFACLVGLAAAPGSAEAAGSPPLVGSVDLYAVAPLSGLALNGFDPVSYFLGPPKPGIAGIELIWGGVAWRFASPANREAFRRDPQVYAPRLGGYDPASLAEGFLAEARPTLFALTAQGLYLFRSDETRRRFLDDETVAPIAEARWRIRRRDVVASASP